MENDPVMSLLYAPIPERLWHYTSVAGSKGIISSKSIWATDVRCLNDAQEFVNIRGSLQQCIDDAPETEAYGFPCKDIVKWAVTEILKSDFMNPDSAQIFVASFSEAGNDLHQWQHYTHDECGVSIGFDLRAFKPSEELGSAVTLAPCIYEKSQKENLVRSSLEHFVSATRTRWTSVAHQFLHGAAQTGIKPTFEQISEVTNFVFGSKEFKDAARIGLLEMKTRVFRLAGLFKHEAFFHEQEWRLVLPLSPGKDKTNLVHPIQYRKGQTLAEIPYIAFPLGVMNIGETPEDAHLPIVDMMLGPLSAETALQEYNNFLNTQNIPVVAHRSQIPLRRT